MKRSVQLAARVSMKTKSALNKVCQAKGIVMSHFVEEAILDKLEELIDLEDIKKLRKERTRPFSEILAELNLDGNL